MKKSKLSYQQRKDRVMHGNEITKLLLLTFITLMLWNIVVILDAFPLMMLFTIILVGLVFAYIKKKDYKFLGWKKK